MRALSSRLPTAWLSRSGCASTQHGSTLELERHILRPPVGVLHRDGIADEEVEAEGLRRGRLLVPACELGQVADEIRQFLELHQHVVDQDVAVLFAELVDAADHLEVGAQAGERRAQLVRGVEDELALGPARGLERLEQAVEGAAQPPQLVRAARGEAARDVGRLGQVLDGVREGIQWDQRGAGDEPPEPDGEQHADQSDCAEQQGELLQLGAHVEQRCDLQRAARDEDARRGPATRWAGARRTRASRCLPRRRS